MKKIRMRYLVGLLVLVALFIGACSDNSDSSSSSSSSSSRTEEQSETKQDIQGITDDKILVGNSAPQSGPVGVYDNVRKGIQAYFNYVNENGGVNGRKLDLIAYDDEYQPSKTLQNMQRLIDQDKVYALVGPIGTANINAAESLLKESGIPVVGLNSGANKFADPPTKNFFPGQFNYKIESKMLVDYAINKLNAEKVTFVYQNDDFGMDNLKYAKEALEQFPEVELVAEIPFLATDTDFSTQAKRVLDNETDAILMFTTPAPAAHLRRELYNLNATHIPFIVNSTGGADINLFHVAGEEVWTGVITGTNIIVDPTVVDDYEVYLEWILKDHAEDVIGFLSQGGWTTAKIFVEALNRAGDDLSWDNFISAMESFDGWKEGFTPEVTYSAKHRYGGTTLFIVETKDMNLSVLEEVYYNPDTEEIAYR